jgi:uncharacterized membrane protein HdeD (DUF308 family)
MIIGILLVLFGIYILNIPQTAYMVMVTFFSISMVITGISELFFYANNKTRNKGWQIAGAAIIVLTGIFLFFNPASTAFGISLFVAFQLLIRSVQGLFFSFSMKDAQVSNWYLLAIISVIGIVLSLTLAAQPMIVGISLVILTGMSFIFAGIIGIAFSIVLKRLKEVGKGVSQHMRQQVRDANDTDYEIVND